jgi:flagellar hook-basal body complex protein FliE
MAIGAIGAIATNALTNVAPAASGVGGAGTTGGFGDVIAKALDGLQHTQAKSDNLATKAATGDLNDIHDYMIASTEASLSTELTVAVRNKAVDAFNDIMKMPI